MLPIIVTIIGELPAALDAIAKIKALLSADGSNFVVQLQTINANALLSASDTLKEIAAWELAHPAK
jgi:hypothetical protein